MSCFPKWKRKIQWSGKSKIESNSWTAGSKSWNSPVRNSIWFVKKIDKLSTKICPSKTESSCFKTKTWKWSNKWKSRNVWSQIKNINWTSSTTNFSKKLSPSTINSIFASKSMPKAWNSKDNEHKLLNLIAWLRFHHRTQKSEYSKIKCWKRMRFSTC